MKIVSIGAVVAWLFAGGLAFADDDKKPKTCPSSGCPALGAVHDLDGGLVFGRGGDAGGGD